MSTVTYGCDDFSRHNSGGYQNLTVLQRLRKKVADIFCAMRHRAEMRQLLTGDPRLLDDIGISQSDVMSALSRSILEDPSAELGARLDQRHEARRR